MNLFVSGTTELEAWVRKLVEVTRPQLTTQPSSLLLEVTTDPSRADCIVTQDPSEQATAPLAKSEPRIPRLLVVHPEQCPDARPGGNDFILIRGAGEALQFAQVAGFLAKRASLSHLSRMVRGPVYHDVRGALSVLALSQQLLDSGAGGQLVSPKLGRAGDKIAAALGYLQHRAACATGEFPPQESAPRAMDALLEIQKSFSALHAERTLDLPPSTHAAIQRAPDWFVFALGGVIDGCARLSSGPLTVEAIPAAEFEGLCFAVLGSLPLLSADQFQAVSHPSGLCVSDPTIIPYRLATACAMLFDAGGEVTVVSTAASLIFNVRLPVRAP